LPVSRSLPKQLAVADGAAPRDLPGLLPDEKRAGRIQLCVNRLQLGHGGDCATGPEGFPQIAVFNSVQTLAVFGSESV